MFVASKSMVPIGSGDLTILNTNKQTDKQSINSDIRRA